MKDVVPLPSTSSQAADVFQGGGEMGALMRSIDWSKTPVGPVECWPQSLRTVLSILLTSRHPMFVFWGEELVQFYNDAYRPILGTVKHPKAMGQPSRECWTEIWDIIGPMTAAVRERGESTFIEDGQLIMERNGYLEEAYFTYAYSPIRDESGGIGGVFAAVSETTERVLGERRLATLSRLAASVGEQKTAADACQEAARVLAAAPLDVSFALLYLLDEDGKRARLAGHVGVEPGSHVAPTEVALEGTGEAGGAWGVADVYRTGCPVRIDALATAVGTLPGGAWPEPASTALVQPLAQPGHAHPAGVLVTGVSPRRALDAKYQSFLELIASHIGSGISNARAYEEERRRAAVLAELDRAKTAFFSNVSHEFRTPLTLMLGPLEDSLADTRTPLAPEQRARQELVWRNGLRLLKLVNTLLDFSRIEAGRARACFEPTDVAALTEELASTFRSAVERAGVRFVVDTPALPQPVWVDREMYEKVMLNLLSNAFKFTLQGEISVSLRWCGAGMELAVRDTGSGIPEHEQPRIFERFHRVQGTQGRTFEGTGIGLSLVQELVKLHSGNIRVQSAPGRGSTFTVFIPAGSAHLPKDQLAASPALRAPASVAALFVEEAERWSGTSGVERTSVTPVPLGARPAQAPRPQLPGHILVADDNEDMRAYLRRLLEAQGWTVEAVADGQEALTSVRTRVPDLVVSDVMMPRLDGFQLLQVLRADPGMRSVPVVLLSARAGEEARIEGLEAGADDYLVKPFTARELVARLQSQLALARMRQTAEAYRTQLRQVFERAPAAVGIVRGPQHVFELVNPAFLEAFGARDLIGKPVREAFPDLANQEFFELLDRVYASGEPFVGNEVLVRMDPARTKRKEERYVNFVYQPLPGIQGEQNGILCFAYEVTDLVMARKQMEALADEAQAADRSKDEFLAMLAHELRNPLAALSAALAVMDRCGADELKQARMRATCHRQVKNLVRLVDDLLDVSRITRGKVELRRERVDLTDIAQSAVQATRSTLEARNHELSVTFAPGAFRLEADPTRLEQIVANLLNNAAKYTEPGGHIFLSLSREVREGRAFAVLKVRDTGRGIPQEMLGRVFDPFVQVDTTIDRTQGGLGIGLTLVKRLAELHGGLVSADSAGPGRGSEFTVRLPLEAEEATPAFPALGEEAAHALAAGPQRVLLVEDNEDARVALEMLLEELGCRVEVATDGLTAVSRLLALRPDLALVDIGLPGIDGYEVARRVRATSGGETLHLVALTGYGGAEARASAEQAGFDRHLVKPVRLSELSAVLSRARASR